MIYGLAVEYYLQPHVLMLNKAICNVFGEILGLYGYTRYLDRDMVILAFILAGILDVMPTSCRIHDLYYTANKIKIGPEPFKIQ